MRAPTMVSDRHLKAITVFLASTATLERGGLPYLDAVLPAEDRLAATRVVRDLGALPPDAILYLLAQPLLDLASDHLRSLSRPGGGGAGAPLPHGPACFRPPDGARPATFLRAADRRARRLSAVEGHHRLIAVAESHKALRPVCSPSLPSSSPSPSPLCQNPRTGLFQPFSAYRRRGRCRLRYVSAAPSAR